MTKISFFPALFALLFAGFYCPAQVIVTIAGNGIIGYSGDGGPATAALISGSNCITFDRNKNIYFAAARRIRKIDRAGIITTFAGDGSITSSGDGGHATAAGFYSIADIAIDTSNNVYIIDDNVVRKINTSGIISTIAGTGLGGYSGDGGPATAAQLNIPNGLDVDDAGNVYIADALNNVIRKIAADGIITTYAGSLGGGYRGDGGPATAARLSWPHAVAADNFGNVYIADESNNVIRKVNAAGIISTFAGNATAGYSGDGGPATLASLSRYLGITVDDLGNVYIADIENHVIRKVTPAGIITTIAGNAYGAGAGMSAGSYTGDGGPATSAGFNGPSDAAVDSVGNMYISEYFNNAVRKVSAISGIPHICIGDSVTFHVPIPGGVWVSSMPGIARLGIAPGVVKGIAAGTATVYYALGTDTASVTVTVAAVPFVGTITGTDSICLGSSATYSVTTSGGIWGLSNGYATTIGNKVATRWVAGFDTVLYSVHYSCGTATAKLPFEIIKPLAGDIIGENFMCVGDTITFTGSIPGGRWGLSSTTNATMVTPGVVKGLATGSNQIFYVVTSFPGCLESVRLSFRIHPPSYCHPTSVGNTAMPNGKTQVYPNPATSTIHVELAAINELRSITITDLLGHSVFATIVPANATQVTIPLQMVQGTYFLYIHGGATADVHKIIVE